VINNSSDLVVHQQLLARNYWKGIDHPELSTELKYPGYFLLSSETENYVKNRAPLIGESNNEVYGKEMGLSSTEIADLEKTGVI
jgi:crotonobetainyl-CoA:carnitine CoA-transferase CaiB-like acyl-CoA transferase